MVEVRESGNRRLDRVAQHGSQGSEISDPSAENIKKHEYATDHFRRLNEWLEREGSPIRYQFNMLTPRDFSKFFQKLRKHDLAEFRLQLDVAVRKANGSA